MGAADPVRVYFATGLVARACTRAYWPLFMVRLVTDLELSPFQLVVLGTIFELTIFVAEIPTGVVADLYSRRLSVILAFLVTGAGMFISAFAEPFWLIATAQILVGVGATFMSGAETAWVTDEVGDLGRVEQLILSRGQWQMIAAIVGIAVFAALAWLTTLSSALGATALTYFGWGAVLIARMPEANFSRNPGQGWVEFVSMLAQGWRRIRSLTLLWLLALIAVIGGLAKEVIDRLDVARLVGIGLPADFDEATVIGAIVVVQTAAAALLLRLVRRRIAGRGIAAAMAGLLVGVVIGVALLARVDVLWVAAAGVVLQGGAHFATGPLVTAWANTWASGSARATVHSFVGQAESLGEVVGGLTLGAAAELWSIRFAMTVSATLFAVVAAVSITAWSRWPAT